MHAHTRTRTAAVLLGAALWLATPASTWAADTAQVTIKGMDYHPGTITVTPGTTVVWTNDDSFAHTVTSDAKDWNSGMLGPGKTFSHTFDKAGRYPYHCAVHVFMTGTVVVK